MPSGVVDSKRAATAPGNDAGSRLALIVGPCRSPTSFLGDPAALLHAHPPNQTRRTDTSTSAQHHGLGCGFGKSLLVQQHLCDLRSSSSTGKDLDPSVVAVLLRFSPPGTIHAIPHATLPLRSESPGTVLAPGPLHHICTAAKTGAVTCPNRVRPGIETPSQAKTHLLGPAIQSSDRYHLPMTFLVNSER